MELVFILSLLVSLNCLNMPELIGKSTSKIVNTTYNRTKFNKYNVTKNKNQ